MNPGFLDKLLARLDRVAPGDVQSLLLNLIREKGFFEQVFEVLHEGVIICDPQGMVTFVNQAACGFFGMDHESTAGRRLQEVVRGLDLEALTGRGSGVVSRDMEVFYPEKRYLNFYLRPIEQAEAANGPLGYVMLIRDITETRKMAEEQMESERMNALTVMAAGVAHEIGNPLNSLNIHLQLLEKKLRKSDPETWVNVRDQLAVARGEVQRLDFIIEQFLGAVRPARPNFELADLNQVIGSAVDFLAPELGDRRIETRLELHDGLPLLRLDTNRMKQALYNLIRNAAQAMGTGGTLTLRSDLSATDVTATIRDTGKGMPPGVVASMHQAWYTTRRSGSGLGMMIVRRIVRDHGGELSVESEEGIGTAVTISLPRGSRAVRFLPAGDTAASPPPPETSDVIDV